MLAAKRILVTGATSGIGGAIAEHFADLGAHLVLNGRDCARGEAACKKIMDRGATAHFLVGDITDPAVPDALVRDTVMLLGRCDILVNAAGILARGSAPDTPDATWDLVLSVNLTAAFRCSRAAVRIMRLDGQGGAIVNVASDWALVGAADALAYATSKAALVQLTRCMALDHAGEGIRVNAVCPGDTDTPMIAAGSAGRAEKLADLGRAIPLGRVADPSDVARACAFLASDAARHITGAALPVDGGASV